MHVKGQVKFPAQGVYDQGANGDIGHKTAVHHVDVQPVGPGGHGLTHMGGQPAKVGR
jgi:hypothetical protein